YEASKNDSLFFRSSYQNRDPSDIRFEGGTALTNLPILNTRVNTASVVGGWTKIMSSTIVNELRAGYNYDNSRRESTFQAADVAGPRGIENAPSLAAGRRGVPSFQFSASPNRPANIADAARNG